MSGSLTEYNWLYSLVDPSSYPCQERHQPELIYTEHGSLKRFCVLEVAYISRHPPRFLAATPIM